MRLVAIFPELKDVEPPNMGSTLPRGRWKKSKKSDADLPPSGERNLLGILLRIRAGKASYLDVCELLKRIEDGNVSSTSVRELLEA